MESRDPIIFDAAKAAGGVNALAAVLGVTRTAVYQWKRVPSERVIAIERATGVHRSVLRPDLYPSETA